MKPQVETSLRDTSVTERSKMNREIFKFVLLSSEITRSQDVNLDEWTGTSNFKKLPKLRIFVIFVMNKRRIIAVVYATSAVAKIRPEKIFFQA